MLDSILLGLAMFSLVALLVIIGALVVMASQISVALGGVWFVILALLFLVPLALAVYSDH